MATLYETLKQAGVDVSVHHESDLYVPNTLEVRGVIRQWRTSPDGFDIRPMPFTCEVTRKPMLDLPFQYAPFWEAKNA